MGYPDLTRIYDDVEKGLTSQEHRLNNAALAQGFWDYDGKKFMSVFMRDAETPFDYVQRPYRMAGLCRQIIEILCDHLYSPGPSRTWDQPAGNKFLQTVYEDNHFNALMGRADQLSALNDVAAVQIDANEGNFQDKPITLRLWGAQDFAVWTDPENRTVPKVACTVDRYDTGTCYRLWNEKEVRRYESSNGEGLADGQKAKYIDTTAHDYGCLPFAFVHYVQPIVSFWESGIGTFLAQGEVRTNDRMSRLDEAINKHLNPLPIVENVDETWQPTVQPMGFMRISSSKMRVGATGGYEDGPQARLYFLEAHVDIAGAWDDLCKFLNQLLQALRVPAEAVRMEQVGVSSGIALIVEQAPLLTRARRRQQPFGLYETEIARTILRCSGGHYGRADLTRAAKTGKLSLAWPQPSVPVPTKDNLDLLLEQVTAGFKSLVMATSEWYGCEREQAFQILEQVEKDNAELEERAPTLALRRDDAQAANNTEDNEGATPSSNDDPTGELAGADEDDKDSADSELAQAV
jgi:hypothetical protein